VLAVVDIVTDWWQAVSLFNAGHPFWASLTATLPMLAFVVACLAVLIGYCTHKDRRQPPCMGCKKFTLMTLKALTTVCEGNLNDKILFLILVF